MTSDEDLVRRFLAGDRAAFSSLVDRHQQRVYNLAYRMLGRPEDAADAAQDAFLACYRKLRGFRGDARFTTWLHRITLNVCYDALRRRAREAPAAGEEGLEPPPAPDPTESSAAAIDVQRALLRVPEDFRAVLVLHDVQGVPYEEIAEALGAPLGTVKSRLHRGRVALARALREHREGAPASNLEESP